MKVNMKVQNIPQQQTTNKPQFKAADSALRFLTVNQAVGANLVDVCFMVAPRSGSDMCKRGPLAGMETLRREIMGTVNDSLIGIYGVLGGFIAAKLMSVKNYTKDANSILAAPETLNILAANKATQIKGNKSQLDYIKQTLQNVKAFNPAAANSDEKGFIKISEKTINEVANILDNVIKEDKITFGEWNSHKAENSIYSLINKIIADTGAESDYILESAARTKVKGVEEPLIKSETNLRTLLEDIFKVSKTFNLETVKEAFKEQVKNGKDVNENAFIKSLQKYLKTKSYTGFALASAVGLSVQPINMYISKKQTGSDGFVGVEGRSKDTSAKFTVIKAASAAAFFAMILGTLKTGLGGFMSKMAFKGKWPTIDQLKGVYGITIISRVMSARDKDELRESLTKDFLGYISWLVLGNFINKMVAHKLDKSLLNQTKEVAKGGYWKQILKSTLKTRDEVLVKALADNGIELTKKEGNKVVAKKFSELLKDIEKLSPELQKVTKSKLRTLNWAQLGGYAFSGIVLGFGIPNLNIYITNMLDKKRKAKLAQAQKAEVA